jgi:F-type H+-transporting ATPase subunit epsilon
MYLTIQAPDNLIFEGKVEKLTLPGSAGTFQVLKNHASLVTTLEHGHILYQVGSKAHTLPVRQGIVEILDNQVNVFVETNFS